MYMLQVLVLNLTDINKVAKQTKILLGEHTSTLKEDKHFTLLNW